jgi:hypothetical protein
MTRATLFLWLGYAWIMASIAAGLYFTRSAAVNLLDTPEQHANWDAWQAETAALSKSDGPMKRREAKAQEPPGLILFRDHFPAIATAIVVSATLFYWFLAFLIRGSLRTPAFGGDDDARAAA